MGVRGWGDRRKGQAKECRLTSDSKREGNGSLQTPWFPSCEPHLRLQTPGWRDNIFVLFRATECGNVLQQQ